MTLTGQGRGHVSEKTYSKVPSRLKQALAFPTKFRFLFNNITYGISQKNCKTCGKIVRVGRSVDHKTVYPVRKVFLQGPSANVEIMPKYKGHESSGYFSSST